MEFLAYSRGVISTGWVSAQKYCRLPWAHQQHILLEVLLLRKEVCKIKLLTTVTESVSECSSYEWYWSQMNLLGNDLRFSYYCTNINRLRMPAVLVIEPMLWIIYLFCGLVNCSCELLGACMQAASSMVTEYVMQKTVKYNLQWSLFHSAACFVCYFSTDFPVFIKVRIKGCF